MLRAAEVCAWDGQIKSILLYRHHTELRVNKKQKKTEIEFQAIWSLTFLTHEDFL